MRSIGRRRVLALGGCLVAQYLWARSNLSFARTKMRNSVPIQFGVISDAHLNLDSIENRSFGETGLRCLRATVKALNEEDLDLVLIMGDLLYDGELHNLVEAKRVLNCLKAPYYIVAGNHDYRPMDPSRQHAGCSYISIEDFVQAFKGHGYRGSGERYWARELKSGLRLIGLDGCLVDEPVSYGGHLPQQQMSWLRRQLAGHKKDLHIIMLHHNVVHWGNDAQSLKGRWFSLENSEEIRALLADYSASIAVVLSGHRHVGLRKRRLADIDYMVVPSISAYPMRYGIFKLSDSELRWRTPDVPVGNDTHRLARAQLIRDPRPSFFNNMSEKEIVAFCENSRLVEGASQL